MATTTKKVFDRTTSFARADARSPYVRPLVGLVGRAVGRSQWRNGVRLSSGTNGFTCALRRERACFSASLPLSVSLSVRRPDRIASLLTPSHQSRVNSEIGSTPASRFALTSRDIAFRLSEIQGGIATSCERATVGPCDSDNFQPFPREREREKDDPRVSLILPVPLFSKRKCSVLRGAANAVGCPVVRSCSISCAFRRSGGPTQLARSLACSRALDAPSPTGSTIK